MMHSHLFLVHELAHLEEPAVGMCRERLQDFRCLASSMAPVRVVNQ